MNIQQCMMSTHGWCNTAYSSWRYTPLKPSQSPLCHTALSLPITSWQYLSGVKRKTSVSAPSIICSILALVGGGTGLLRGGSLKQSAMFPENMAGIWLWGRWVYFWQEKGGMRSTWEGVLKGGRGTSEPVPHYPQLSVAERCICDVNMWGADENMHLKQR